MAVAGIWLCVWIIRKAMRLHDQDEAKRLDAGHVSACIEYDEEEESEED